MRIEDPVVRHSWIAGVLLFVLALLSTSAAFAGVSYPNVAKAIIRQVTADRDAVKALKGKTLAIVRFENKSDDEDVDPALLQEKLTTAAIKAKIARIVERTKLDKTLKELKFNAGDGLIDPAEQKKLGRILGASYLLLGTISGDADDLIIDVRIIEVETGEALTAAEYPEPDEDAEPERDSGEKPAETATRARMTLIGWSSTELIVSSEALRVSDAKNDAVIWVVEEKVLNGAGDVVKAWHSDLMKNIYDHPERYITEVKAQEDAYYLHVNLTRLMRDVVVIIFGKVTPRIAVDTTEQILHRPVPDPAVQTKLNSVLLGYGFQVIDSKQAHLVLSREAVRQAMYSNDPDAGKLVQDAAGELHADILAVGESFAEQRTAGDGFDARVEIHVKEAATARLLASVENSVTLMRSDQPRLDPTSGVFAKLTLQKAAEGAALRLSGEMLKAFGQPVYQLRIWKVKEYAQVEEIVDALKESLPGAKIILSSTDLRASKCIVLQIETKKTADAVARALNAVSSPKIRVTGIECRSLVAELR